MTNFESFDYQDTLSPLFEQSLIDSLWNNLNIWRDGCLDDITGGVEGSDRSSGNDSRDGRQPQDYVFFEPLTTLAPASKERLYMRGVNLSESSSSSDSVLPPSPSNSSYFGQDLSDYQSCLSNISSRPQSSVGSLHSGINPPSAFFHLPNNTLYQSGYYLGVQNGLKSNSDNRTSKVRCAEPVNIPDCRVLKDFQTNLNLYEGKNENALGARCNGWQHKGMVTSKTISLLPKSMNYTAINSRLPSPNLPNQSMANHRLPNQSLIELKQKLKAKGGTFCNFCYTNNESEDVVTCHNLRSKVNGVSKLTCPILRSYVCPECHKTGDEAHTITYCPLVINKNGQKRPTPIAHSLNRCRKYK